VDSAVGQKSVAKRRSLGSIIRSRLSRAVKPSGRSLSADRAAVQRPSDLEPAARNVDRRPLITPPPQPTFRTAFGKFYPSSTIAHSPLDWKVLLF